MKSGHISWDSTIVNRLDELRISDDAESDVHYDRIVSRLREYGFALLTGLARSGNRNFAASQLLKLSEELGTVLPQSPRNEKIEDIRDFSDVDKRDDRGYRSAGELTPHSDPPTLICLHCLTPAKSGGETFLVNVRKIHDAIETADPELLDVLYQGMPHWLVEGQTGGPGPAAEPRPVFMRNNGMVSCVHYRPFIEKAAMVLEQPLSAKQIAALDLFDHYANDDTFALRFYLQADETIILHNRTVLHARTDYEDWPEPDKRRHLLRSWIDAAELLPVSPQHELGNMFEIH